MSSVRISKNQMLRLARVVLGDIPDGQGVTAKEFGAELGITSESAAKDFLNELSDAGDVDRFYPPNEPGKRGRAAAQYRTMTETRRNELAPVVEAREAVSRALKDLPSSNVTLRKVTVSLQDICKLLGLAVPPDVFSEIPGDDDGAE